MNIPWIYEMHGCLGRNGAGKTRFLKALEQYYKDSNPNASVLTLYFPESHSNREEISNKNLYDAIYEKDVLCYQDFLQLASKDWLALIDDIYSGMSLRAKKSAQRMQADFEQLNKYFLIFFDSELCPKEGNSKIHMVKHINGTDRKVPVEQAIKEFSPGELMLFYLSILVFYLDHLSDISIVLIMDEPEIHLHPKALIALMEMLTKSNAISQLWVASHSLFIMPLFPFEQIVHFDRNHICPLNRNTYKRIYDDLIGLENIDVWTCFLFRSINIPESQKRRSNALHLGKVNRDAQDTIAVGGGDSTTHLLYQRLGNRQTQTIGVPGSFHGEETVKELAYLYFV